MAIIAMFVPQMLAGALAQPYWGRALSTVPIVKIANAKIRIKGPLALLNAAPHTLPTDASVVFDAADICLRGWWCITLERVCSRTFAAKIW